MDASKLVWLDMFDAQLAADAIRRDMRRERELALTDKVWAQWHEWNARKDIELLEQIMPKHARPANAQDAIDRCEVAA